MHRKEKSKRKKSMNPKMILWGKTGNRQQLSKPQTYQEA